MASRLPSARPGSPTSMAEARRLRVRPPRPCAPSRDLKCLAYVKRCVALCSRARRRATTNKEQPRRPSRPGRPRNARDGPRDASAKPGTQKHRGSAAA